MHNNHPTIGIRPVIDGRWGGVREGLEAKTWQMARAAQALVEENCRYSDGTPAKCVLSPCTIGGSAEAAKCAAGFAGENVCATLSVTPCWCYGSETMDTDPLTVKAVWGFNGTERPGAVYLAAVMAAHAQAGLPAFSIYGHDVQDVADESIPDDAGEKILRFARCALALGQIKGRSYVGIGSVSMGIMGSYTDAGVMQRYFGLRPEWVDMSEVRRRVDLEIYDKEEYEIALAWVKANCPEGFDKNDEPSPRARKDWEWEFVTKMTLVCRDILLGNPKLDGARPSEAAAGQNGLLADGWHEEALGRNAILGGFQGQRQWTDYMPNCDFTEAILNSSFDWNGRKEPLTFATENDGLNGLSMLVGKLLTGTASVFADVRTYWSPEAVLRVTGQALEGRAAGGIIHLINSGAAALDATGASDGKIKPWWEVSESDIAAMLAATDWCPADKGYFRGGGFSSHFKTLAEMPATMLRFNIVEGIGPVLQIAEGWTVTLPDEVHNTLDQRTDPTWPTTWFAPRVVDTEKNTQLANYVCSALNEILSDCREGEKLKEHVFTAIYALRDSIQQLETSTAFADVYSVMANWGANHGSLTYGHIGRDLITLASMLRIPVSMHNVPDGDVYRPHCWAAFGTKDLESADYRACGAYGARF